VSGQLGAAELGLQLIRKSKRRASRNDPRLRKHLYPEPRLALGRWLAETRLSSAMMDLSDGLSTDLPRLCAASGVGARVEEAQIPAARLLKSRQSQGDNPFMLALHGGDDYELLFSVPRKHLKRIPPSFHGLPITAIGEITKDSALLLIDVAGGERPLLNLGWDPFRGRR
jgi:thiamine-monophosphate kinase